MRKKSLNKKIIAAPTLDCYQLLTLQYEQEVAAANQKEAASGNSSSTAASGNSSRTSMTPVEVENTSELNNLFQSLFGEQKYSSVRINVAPMKNPPADTKAPIVFKPTVPGETIFFGKGGPTQSLPKNSVVC